MNALRAFEASARHVSFTLAANELGVSQAAVSRSVLILEDSLGTGLFVRRKNGLELTEAGTLLAPELRNVFERIDQLMRETQVRGRVTKVLTVGIGPTLATRWLIPRLGRFTSAQPDIEIRIATRCGSALQRGMDLRHTAGSGPLAWVYRSATFHNGSCFSLRAEDG